MLLLSVLKKAFGTRRRQVESDPGENHSEAAQKNYTAGVYFAQKGDLPRAISMFEKCLRDDPQHYLSHVGIGNIKIIEGEYDQSIAHFQKALELQPNSPALLINYSNALRLSGKLHEALPLAEFATRLTPNNPDYLTNLGLAHQDLGELDQAEACFHKAVQIAPGHSDARLHFALLNLLRGRFSSGWPDYELRRNKSDTPVRESPYPQWNGEPIADGGALLIYAEQGVGDEIMFGSCIEDALAIAKHCVVECSPKVAPLFQRSFPHVAVIPGDQKTELRNINHTGTIAFATPIGSLPLRFRTNTQDFPTQPGYLSADPDCIDHWAKRLEKIGPGRKVGISWSGGLPRTRSRLRSIPLAQWTPLITAPDIEFISLQHRINIAELEDLYAQSGVRVHHWPTIGDDLDETAAVIQNLDLVISVQNTVVHLAGALGSKTWAIVPICPEWRYGYGSASMPWYPSVRIYRQTELGNWRNIFELLAKEINREFG